MNYRHAFHAGGPADVVKHAVLARILVHLSSKPAAFRVIDTHAGAGLYDLRGPEATRSPEWRHGIERLLAAPIESEARALLAPYLDAVRALEGDQPALRTSTRNSSPRVCADTNVDPRGKVGTDKSSVTACAPLEGHVPDRRNP